MFGAGKGLKFNVVVPEIATIAELASFKKLLTTIDFDAVVITPNALLSL